MTPPVTATPRAAIEERSRTSSPRPAPVSGCRASTAIPVLTRNEARAQSSTASSAKTSYPKSSPGCATTGTRAPSVSNFTSSIFPSYDGGFQACGICAGHDAKHPAERQVKQAGPAGDLPGRGRHSSKRACKPNSVVCGHSSRRRVAADAHQRPTRRFRHLLEPPVAYRADTLRGLVLAACASLPIWSCSVWGLPCLTLYSGSGALLPHLFTLTPARRKQASCGMPDSLAKAQVAEAVSSLWHWPSSGLEA